MLKKIYEFIVYSNIYIGIAAFSQTYLFYISNNIRPDFSYLAFVFFGTIICYLFAVGYPKKSEAIINNPRINWMNKNATIVHPLMISCIIFSIYYFFKLENKILILIFSIISLCYNISAEIIGFKGLRNIAYLKVFLISFVWVIVCNLIPSINSINNIDLNQYMLMLSKFIWIIALTLPFDVRDIYNDSSQKIQTIPIKLGAKKTLFLSIILFSFSILLHYLFDQNQSNLISHVISSIIGILLVLKIMKHDSEKDYLLFLDGLLIFQLLIYCVINI